MNPLKAERAKPSLSSDYNLLFKNKIGESSLDIHRLLTEMQQPFQECIDRLMSIPHLKEISARLIFAEIGPDLSSFTSL